MPRTTRSRRPATGGDRSLGSCRSCGRPIRWYRTASDARMPCDPDPHPDGTIEVRAAIGMGVCAVVLRAQQLEEARAAGTKLLIHHRATCPARAKR